MNIDFSKAIADKDQLPALRAARLQQLNADYEAAVAKATVEWPVSEMMTWTTQSDEARQWVAAAPEDKPSTPFLTALYNNRKAGGVNEQFADLVAKVISNGDSYTASLAKLTAIRHVASFAITEATDPSTVTWSF